VPQEQTEALLLEQASAGRRVVRLKGGDPFVFGRGGEEALALREAGIEFEVVPGVSAGVAASAYAGIPVTHRGLARAVAFVTGRTGDESDLDWEALAAFPGTLVFYMGVGRLAEIAASLIGAGRAAGEPAAVVEAGTLPAQRTVLGTLATIAEQTRAERVGSPSITIVGPVAALSEKLAWFAKPPLAGLSVAVTRARAQASGLARTLGELGAEVVQAPAIRVERIAGPPLDPSPYDLICVTSANAARELFERLAGGGRDARALAGAKVASIGAGTSAELERHGIRADLTAERSVGEGMVEALAGVPFERALVARARGGREMLPDALRERGEVEVLELYESVAEPLSAETVAEVRAADYVTFTSASTVRNLLGALEGAGGLGEGTRVVSIGPITSEALREHGVGVDVEAERHDVDGVLQALLADTAARGR
jgi:uroporphyrinogen III methyltransferase/synthase